jgi:predicted lipid-binding transport protein (Tim44 family)
MLLFRYEFVDMYNLLQRYIKCSKDASMNIPESITVVDFVILIITLFLGYQIYRALGMRTGTEKKRHGFSPRDVSPSHQESAKAQDENEVREELTQIDDPKLALKLEKIIKADPSFHINQFLQGVKNAFELILKRFLEGDKAALKPLLSPQMYNQFSALIDQREKKKQTADLAFFRMVNAEIVEAECQKKTVRMRVLITSEQTLLIKEGDNKVVDGDPDYIDTVTDTWTFERKIDSGSSIWILKEIADASE